MAIGCSGGGASAPKTPGSAAPKTPGSVSINTAVGKASVGSGSLILTDAAGLVEYNVENGSCMLLITPATENTFLLDPAVSPDGKRLVYIVQPPPKIINNCE